MDKNNINIKFARYFADGTLKSALKHRVNPMELESFCNAVNQEGTGCSCCKNDTVRVYAIYPIGIVQIKPTILSLCAECCSKLPTKLEVINIDSCGTPPTLIHSWREV